MKLQSKKTPVERIPIPTKVATLTDDDIAQAYF